MADIRPAVPGDAAAIEKIESERGIGSQWMEPGRPCVVAAESDSIVGYAVWREVSGEAQILMVAVAEAHGKKGIGRKLLDRLLADAQRAGCRAANLEVSENNIAARRLYESASFQFVARRAKYYNDGSDALLMDRAL